MKSKIYALTGKALTGLAILLLTVLVSFSAIGQVSTITVISPNGGESFVTGSTIEVSWTNTGDAGDLVIEFTDDGGVYWYSAAYVYAGDTTTSLTLQYYGYATELGKVRVSYYYDPSNSDESDGYFSVVESPVYFSSPYFGDSYYVNHPVYISWYSYTLTSFNIDYSLDNGATWTNLVTDTAAYEYYWDSPAQTSDQAFIRISDPSDPSSYGLSPVFSIVAEPVCNVVAPNGGETWNYGEYATVSWTGSNLPPYVYIEFSGDGGASWSYLAYGYSEPAGGSAEVSVPYISTENALIRITDYYYSIPLDESDAPFTVSVPPVIVYYPSGGEQYYNSQTMYFSWIASNDVSLVNFALSTDNGLSWQTIEEGVDAMQGYYYWTVAGTPSQNCQIRISDSADPAKYGISGVFTILETPVITLTSPVGGEIWNTNQPYTISWTYDNPAASYVYLEYSTDNGLTWNFINYSLVSGTEGSFEWVTPDVSSNQCLVRIMDYYLTFVSDTSAPFTVITYPETSICMVTVDSATNHNVIVWEKPVSDLIDKFVVYKESNEANVFEVLGMVDYSAEGILADTNSNPNVKPYRYKLGFADADGNLYPAGALHQTVHLTINQGVGNTWNLIWTGYQGFDVSSYNLYRKSGTGSYEPIASISASFTSYTDLSAPAGDVYYIVESVNPAGCTPNRDGQYTSSWSNVATNSVLGVNEPSRVIDLTTFPNPANDKISISTGETLKGKVSVIITDLLGHSVHSEVVETMKPNSIHTINIADLKEGLYMLKVTSEDGSVTKKVVVKR